MTSPIAWELRTLDLATSDPDEICAIIDDVTDHDYSYMIVDTANDGDKPLAVMIPWVVYVGLIGRSREKEKVDTVTLDDVMRQLKVLEHVLRPEVDDAVGLTRVPVDANGRTPWGDHVYEPLMKRPTVPYSQRRHFVPDYGSEGEY